MSAHPAPRTIAPERVVIPEGHRLHKAWVLAAAVGVVATVAAFLVGGDDALPAYLVAYLFALTFALGGLFFNLSQLAARAGWSVVVRRLAEHMAGTLPLFALLFLPIALGAPRLFEWMHQDVVASDALLQEKSPFLNAGFFYARAAFYLLVWSFLGWWFRRESLRQDREGAPGITRKLQAVAAPSLFAFALTVTFAAFDWIMSLYPHWYSTMFGVYFFAGCAVAVFAYLALLGVFLDRQGFLAGAVTVEHLHDVGKLLFAFTVFWAYIAFSQFMLIWYGNIPEETTFFALRWTEAWRPWSIALAVGHFVIPFFFLLPRTIKRNPLTLSAGAGWLLLMHYLDLYWLVMPVFRPEHSAPGLADLFAFIGLVSLFKAALFFLLRRPALVPVRDPRLPESLTFENM